MPTLTIELRRHDHQTPLNLRRWAELLRAPELAKFEGRVETDRHGRIIVTLPLPAVHGMLQAEIGILLHRFMPQGRVITVCPISTADGVKAADVAWASPACMQELGNRVCFPRAPEICVEVLSPSNTRAEIREKTALFFNAGAKEVWLCQQSGAMSFFGAGSEQALRASKICPEFPKQIELR